VAATMSSKGWLFHYFTTSVNCLILLSLNELCLDYCQSLIKMDMGGSNSDLYQCSIPALS